MTRKFRVIRLMTIDDSGDQADTGTALIVEDGNAKQQLLIRNYRDVEEYEGGTYVLFEDSIYRAKFHTGLKPFDLFDFEDVEGIFAIVPRHSPTMAYVKDELVVGPANDFEDYPIWYAQGAVAAGAFDEADWDHFHPGETLVNGYGYLDPSVADELPEEFKAYRTNIEPQVEWPFATLGPAYDVRLESTLYQDTDCTIHARHEGDPVKGIKPFNTTDTAHRLMYESGTVGRIAYDGNGQRYVTRGKDSVYSYASSANLDDQCYWVASIPRGGVYKLTELDTDFKITVGEQEEVLMTVANLNFARSTTSEAFSEYVLDRASFHYDHSVLTTLAGFFKNCIYAINGVGTIHAHYYDDISEMFMGCTLPGVDLRDWHTHTVKKADRTFMNANVTGLDLHDWELDVCESMEEFLRGSNYNGDASFKLPVVKNINGFFADNDQFNQSLADFEAPQATTAVRFLADCALFDQDLDTLSLPNVRDATGFLEGCLVFNSPIQGIDLTEVVVMDSFLKNCPLFNQSLADQLFPNVVSMRNFLENGVAYNNPLNVMLTPKLEDVSYFLMGCINFNTSIGCLQSCETLTHLTGLLHGCRSFNTAFASETYPNVVNADDMLRDCSSFNQDLDGLEFPKLESAKRFLRGSTTFNGKIEGIHMPNVRDLSEFLLDCRSFNQPIAGFDIASCSNFEFFLQGAQSFNQPFDNWNTHLAYNMNGMLQGCASFEQSLLRLCTTRITQEPTNFATGSQIIDEPIWGLCPKGRLASSDMIAAFDPAVMNSMFVDEAMTKPVTGPGQLIRAMKDLSGNNNHAIMPGYTSPIYEEDADGNPYILIPPNRNFHIASVDQDVQFAAVVPGFGLIEQRHRRHATPGFSYWGISSFTKLGALLIRPNLSSSNLIGGDEVTFAGDNKTELSGLFCSVDLTITDITELDTAHATEMNLAFKDNRSFNSELQWDTSNVTSAYGMFSGAILYNQDFVSQLDLSKVRNLVDFLAGAVDFNQSLDGLNLPEAVNIGSFLQGCVSFNSPLGTWIVPKIDRFDNLLRDCISFNQSIDGLGYDETISASGMLAGCISFNQPVNVLMEKCFYINDFFRGCIAFNQNINTFLAPAAFGTLRVLKDCTAFNNGGVTLDFSLDGLRSRHADMRDFFMNCEALRVDIIGIRTRQGTNLDGFLSGIYAYGGDLSSWCVETIPVEPDRFSEGINEIWKANAALQPKWGEAC